VSHLAHNKCGRPLTSISGLGCAIRSNENKMRYREREDACQEDMQPSLAAREYRASPKSILSVRSID
jgi:hypothetical protein